MGFVAMAVAIAVTVALRATHLAELKETLDGAAAAAIERSHELEQSLDASDFVVTQTERDGFLEWERRGNVILAKSPSFDRYLIVADKDGLVPIWVNRDGAPEMLIEPGLEYGIVLKHLDSGDMEITVIGKSNSYAEQYLVNADSVEPVSPEAYKKLLIAIGMAEAEAEQIAPLFEVPDAE